MDLGERLARRFRGNEAKGRAWREHRTKSSAFVLYAALSYALVMFWPLGEENPLLLLAAFGFVVGWLGTPLALWIDIGYVRARSRWSPRRWVYIPLALVPGLIGMVVLLHYFDKRHRVLSAEVAPVTPASGDLKD